MDEHLPTYVTTRSLVLRIATVAAVAVIASLLVNTIVTDQLGPGAERHSVWVIGDDIGFEYVRNTGAAFGIFQGNAELLAAISIVVSIALVVLMLGEISSAVWATLAAGLTVGGALGNLIGRMADGYVTDYVAIGPWPRFNVSDSAITVGIAIFVVFLVFERSSYPTWDDQDAEAGRMRLAVEGISVVEKPEAVVSETMETIELAPSDEDRNERLDRYVAAAVPELSRSAVQALIDDGHVSSMVCAARRRSR